MKALLSTLALIIASAAPTAAADCEPFETRQPNAPEQRPAFPGQTRACAVESDVAFEVEVLAKGLDEPWAVEPLPGGDLLVTEKPGRLRIVSAKGELGEPIAGLPPVDGRGQAGCSTSRSARASSPIARFSGATPSRAREATAPR